MAVIPKPGLPKLNAGLRKRKNPNAPSSAKLVNSTINKMPGVPKAPKLPTVGAM